ncbi:unnamed protein product [Gordionus sp. m RMFG-2023]
MGEDFKHIITNCQLRNRTIYGARDFRINLMKDKGQTYNIKIKFRAPKSLMPNYSIIDYSYMMYEVRDKEEPYLVFLKFNNQPMEKNELVNKNLVKGVTYFIQLAIAYSPFTYFHDFSAWKIFKSNLILAPRINNACVIDLGKGIFNISVTWDSKHIEQNFTGFVLGLTSTRIDKSSIWQTHTIKNAPSLMANNLALHYGYVLNDLDDIETPQQISTNWSDLEFPCTQCNPAFPIRINLLYRNSTRGIRHVDLKLAPRIKKACVIDLGNGLFNIWVSWDSNHIKQNFYGFIIKLRPTIIDTYSLSQEHFIKNPRKNSFDFSNVTSNREYIIAIRVLFKYYDNNKMSNFPYAFHTIFITAL